MLSTVQETVMRELYPFWDDAAPGATCAVPCWPVDQEGDAEDCPHQAVIVGVLGEDGMFRAEEVPPFDPREEIYVCGDCKSYHYGE